MAIANVGTAFSGARDSFYNPQQFQQDPFMDWTQTQAIGGPSGYLEQNPQAAWTRYLAQNQGIGLGDDSPYAQYARNLYQNTQRGFEAGLAEDPTLIFQRYLSTLPNFQQQFMAQTPQQRGENPGRYAGPVRWIADI